MITYLIKMTSCALLFYVTYALLFEKENLHHFKRIYLLAGLIFSLLIPFVEMGLDTPRIPADFRLFYAEHETVAISENQLFESETIALPVKAATNNYSLLIQAIYAMITAFFLFRFLRNCLRMLQQGRENGCIDFNGAKIALVKGNLVPHSFGRYIFINREDYDNGLIPEEIMTHEWTHVRQRHTFDILFIELLVAFGWFNPVFYLYRNKIKQNHEFLADDAVIGKNRENVPAYQTILINFAPQNGNVLFSAKLSMNFVSYFKYSFIKKRLIMMSKTTTKKRVWCSIIALIPVVIAAIFIFSTQTVAQYDEKTLPEQTAGIIERRVQDNNSIVTPGKGASQEQMTEFQQIVEKYFDNSKKNWKCIDYYLSEDDQARLYAIYVQMDENQRKEQMIRFVGPLTAEKARKSITQSEWKKWNQPDKGNEIWLDGEHVEHTTLASYSRGDFTFFISRHYPVVNGIFRIDLWTKKGFENYLQKNSEQITRSKLLEIPPQTWFKINKPNNEFVIDSIVISETYTKISSSNLKTM